MLKSKLYKVLPFLAVVILTVIPFLVKAGNTYPLPQLFGIRIEFLIFGLTLVGIALFQRQTMYVSLVGLLLVLLFKYIADPGFSFAEHLIGNQDHTGEWRLLLNLLGLLLGFTILANYFEESGIPNVLPSILPDDWKGGLVLLIFTMIMSAFLDNIAAAMIGGTMAFIAYSGRVHIGFLAAIVAASNAGGTGSVLGDTTTTMMWIDGVSPYQVLHAFIGSIGAFLIFGIIGSIQQDRYQKIRKDPVPGITIDYAKLGIVILILLGALVTNWTLDFPALGVWLAILAGSLLRKPKWNEIPKAIKGTIFLLALVISASLMPVNELPAASWSGAFFLGLVSAVFDNIPLTKLCLDQGGYDWGVLAYAIGFGGSMVWFGSSAGVALSNMFPETKSVIKYIKGGWHVSLAYIAGFFLLLLLMGWHPAGKHKEDRNEKIEDSSLKESSLNLLPLPDFEHYTLLHT